MLSILYGGAYFSLWEWCWFALYFFIGQKAYARILNELEQGIAPNYSLDIFCVFAASQLLNTGGLWPFGSTLVLCAVPAYLAYFFGGWVVSWVVGRLNKSTQVEENEQ